ncbi:hypothetical protein AVEN_106746-1 [Araneus ventricosus]|uniref:Uncharacterized protein n=1 Tax=Araneus ventricosus TaxID=182803 RepID=A0A4Y2F328_ARAVE|nr:hypothetical protein AVEN_106746-1 [Araneus ventricosus]
MILNWDEGKTGRKVHDILPKVSLSPSNWGRAEVLFFTGHGPFQYFLKRFHLSHTSNCSCGEEGTPIHCATDCILTTSWHMTKPSAYFEKEWYRSVASNQLSRNKIRTTIAHITNYNLLQTRPAVASPAHIPAFCSCTCHGTLIIPQFLQPKEQRSNTSLAMRFCFGTFNDTCTKGSPLEEDEEFELDQILEKT